MNRLRQYVRHVELYGTEGVLEAAKRDLSPNDLGALVMQMRRIEPNWSLTQTERQRLGWQLIEEGASDKQLRNVLDVGQAAIRALRSAE